MPLEVTERLWLEPGPQQGGQGAPRLMLLYPRAGTTLGFDTKLTRYAGRVDPPDARVLLDGKPIRVWRGGVFTGLLSIPVGRRTVTFSSDRNGPATTIRRTITRLSRELGPNTES